MKVLSPLHRQLLAKALNPDDIQNEEKGHFYDPFPGYSEDFEQMFERRVPKEFKPLEGEHHRGDLQTALDSIYRHAQTFSHPSSVQSGEHEEEWEPPGSPDQTFDKGYEMDPYIAMLNLAEMWEGMSILDIMGKGDKSRDAAIMSLEMAANKGFIDPEIVQRFADIYNKGPVDGRKLRPGL